MIFLSQEDMLENELVQYKQQREKPQTKMQNLLDVRKYNQYL